MGVSTNSPVHPKSASTEIQAAKAKALTVIRATETSASSPISKPSSPGEDGGERDLAEELNAQTRARYKKGKLLGEGTYANVFLGHDTTSPNTLVAIKKTKKLDSFKDGMSIDTIREIRFLQELKHPNIINLMAVFSSKDQNVNMVIELLPRGDLKTIYYRGADAKGPEVSYTGADIKAWMAMLMRAVWFCHEHFVMHRDIKGDNLLIAADGSLKLADFGLARSFADPGTRMTPEMVTSFYRPPELFLGATHYSAAVDIWSCGIVLGELVKRDYWVPGHTDLEIFTRITEVFGSPSEANWPGVTKLPNAPLINPSDDSAPRPPGMPTEQWNREFGQLGPIGIDLLRSMTSLDPRKRPTAKQILAHDWFRTAPAPTKTELLPQAGGGGGPVKMAEDLKRKPGEAPSDGRADKVARKIDFGSMKK
ncbi:protease-like protein [Pseudovirgaria hyperparasitica]|uniref:Protease-like protein n=1 Tax=Pseudovirgaria hyperparasitica TaxID=470096 RepID=A0A6A6W4U6_9PEZI|nr:protease-like protein [Pseudovirgaria hyperparasitica]KAF2757199.1 protease-like protein [Pseudovirgaria hyperparasitica]